MGLQYRIHDYDAQRPILETRRPDAADRLADACTKVLKGAAAYCVFALLVAGIMSGAPAAHAIAWLIGLVTQ